MTFPDEQRSPQTWTSQAPSARSRAADAALARDLAGRAGELVLALRPQLVEGLESAAAGRADDAAAQDFLAQALRAYRSADAILSEEAEQLVDADGTPSRLKASRVWIIDPLDGTREYVVAGRDDWAVHVALWARTSGGMRSGLLAGAVALPAQGLTLSTAEPAVVPPRPDAGAPWRVVVSRSRPPAFLEALAASVPLEVRPHGSAGAKAAEVVLGRADAYLHASSADGSGLNEWDSAAPVAVAQAAGLHVSHLDGSDVVFNQPSHVSGDLVICRPELAPTLLAALAPLVT